MQRANDVTRARRDSGQPTNAAAHTASRRHGRHLESITDTSIHADWKDGALLSFELKSVAQRKEQEEEEQQQYE